MRTHAASTGKVARAASARICPDNAAEERFVDVGLAEAHSAAAARPLAGHAVHVADADVVLLRRAVDRDAPL